MLLQHNFNVTVLGFTTAIDPTKKTIDPRAVRIFASPIFVLLDFFPSRLVFVFVR